MRMIIEDEFLEHVYNEYLEYQERYEEGLGMIKYESYEDFLEEAILFAEMSLN